MVRDTVPPTVTPLYGRALLDESQTPIGNEDIVSRHRRNQRRNVDVPRIAVQWRPIPELKRKIDEAEMRRSFPIGSGI